ncbi:hypothetical protein [Parapedobacter sp. 2B3]|uniref:hypothetical protein n=1 Tax=Parapedobacter sp. 2B3 TaxID=3342381 RepID=UPI0035B67D05
MAKARDIGGGHPAGSEQLPAVPIGWDGGIPGPPPSKQPVDMDSRQQDQYHLGFIFCFFLSKLTKARKRKTPSF